MLQLLAVLPCMSAMSSWRELLAVELEQPYFTALNQFVTAERRECEVYPPHELVFAALAHAPLDAVRVVILGQDPYHGPGQAEGLSFSVPTGVQAPPSLQNIFKELVADLEVPKPTTASLVPWANQGVLLLNTVLTVRGGAAGSHRGKGWEQFTDKIIQAVAARDQHTVFILWGNDARKKKALIEQSAGTTAHTIIESAHPSPLSAYNGFFGSKPFSRTNAALVAQGQPPLDWKLP